MNSHLIRTARSEDVRFPLPEGAGSDAVHSNPVYCLAVTNLESDWDLHGTGIVLTVGDGNQLVCDAINLIVQQLVGSEIESLMADFGQFSRHVADHPEWRWVGPHKGVIHLALASVTNACFDLWAKARGVPLWKLLRDLSPEQIVSLLDLSYLEDVLPKERAIEIVRAGQATSSGREDILARGYPGYDTSVGWFRYDDAKVRDSARRALDEGFTAFKLKVGSADPERDIRRAHMLRELVGDDALVMLDANQQWTLPRAVSICRSLRGMSPFWVEEPTHPDDIAAHRVLADEIQPMLIALGEHVPNRVMFKNFMAADAVHFVQVDCTRVAGISEFLTVSLLSRAHNVPVVPHVGDMGQIHQHLVLFNHIALGLPALFLEHIPHLREHFVHPAKVEGGLYVTPQEPGSSSDLVNRKGR